MPIKRRKDKRRAAPAPEAWEMIFASGHDYFDELAELGLADWINLPSDTEARTAAKAAWDEATRNAWERYGAAFLRQWQEHPGRKNPWALETFGPPEKIGDRNAD